MLPRYLSIATVPDSPKLLYTLMRGFHTIIPSLPPATSPFPSSSTPSLQPRYPYSHHPDMPPKLSRKQSQIRAPTHAIIPNTNSFLYVRMVV